MLVSRVVIIEYWTNLYSNSMYLNIIILQFLNCIILKKKKK